MVSLQNTALASSLILNSLEVDIWMINFSLPTEILYACTYNDVSEQYIGPSFKPFQRASVGSHCLCYTA